MKPAGMQLTVSLVRKRSLITIDLVMVKATSRDRACDSGLSRVKSIFPRRNFSPLPHTEKRANHFKNKTGTSIIESKTFSILFLVFAQSFKGLI